MNVSAPQLTVRTCLLWVFLIMTASPGVPDSPIQKVQAVALFPFFVNRLSSSGGSLEVYAFTLPRLVYFWLAL